MSHLKIIATPLSPATLAQRAERMHAALKKWPTRIERLTTFKQQTALPSPKVRSAATHQLDQALLAVFGRLDEIVTVIRRGVLNISDASPILDQLQSHLPGYFSRWYSVHDGSSDRARLIHEAEQGLSRTFETIRADLRTLAEHPITSRLYKVRETIQQFLADRSISGAAIVREAQSELEKIKQEIAETYPFMFQLYLDQQAQETVIYLDRALRCIALQQSRKAPVLLEDLCFTAMPKWQVMDSDLVWQYGSSDARQAISLCTFFKQTPFNRIRLTWAEVDQLSRHFRSSDITQTMRKNLNSNNFHLSGVPAQMNHPLELFSVRFYTRGGDEFMNRILRGLYSEIGMIAPGESNPCQLAHEVCQLIALASSALNRLPSHNKPFSHTPHVFRGVDLTLGQRLQYRRDAIVLEPAFTSTADVESSVLSGNTLFVIEGVTGKKIERWSHKPHEAEVLFLPGTKFRVMDKQLSGNQCVIHLEEVR